MPPSIRKEVPITSVECVAKDGLKMGWMEKEAEESRFGAGWHKKFLVLTGWEQGEAHLFYFDKETDVEAGGVLFVNDVNLEDPKGDHRIITLQGSQRRFRFRCENDIDARSWRLAILEAKSNGGHKCKQGIACSAWMQEKHAKTCDKCRGVFSSSNKKHQCRCCGRIFCHSCSAMPKIQLEPFKGPVRCCNHCNETQVRLEKEAKARAERTHVFISKHLGVLEEGSDFSSLQRSDLLRHVALDNATGMSLQYRKLIVTEKLVHEDLAVKMQKGSSTAATRIKSATMKLGGAVVALRPHHVVDAFKPTEIVKNTTAIKTSTMAAGSNFANDLKNTAATINDMMEGPRQHEIEVKHIQGILDYAGNPTIQHKYPSAASRTLAIFIKGANVPLELVAATEEGKAAWLEALTELKVLAEDVGCDVLVIQQHNQKINSAVADKLQARRAERQSQMMDAIRSKSMSQAKPAPDDAIRSKTMSQAPPAAERSNSDIPA